MHSNNSKFEWAKSNCEDVEIVSANYKGHKKYIPNSEIFISSTSYRNREEAKHELRAMAKYYGRDIIIDCKCEKEQCQDGNYIYNEWGYSGIAVNKKVITFIKIPKEPQQCGSSRFPGIPESVFLYFFDAEPVHVPLSQAEELDEVSALLNRSRLELIGRNMEPV